MSSSCPLFHSVTFYSKEGLETTLELFCLFGERTSVYESSMDIASNLTALLNRPIALRKDRTSLAPLHSPWLMGVSTYDLESSTR